MVTQMGFNTCFSEHLCMASSYVSKLNSQRPSVNFTKRFPEEILKVHEWLLLSPDFF